MSTGRCSSSFERFIEALENGGSASVLGACLDRIRKLGYGGSLGCAKSCATSSLERSDENRNFLTPTEIEVLELFADGKKQ